MLYKALVEAPRRAWMNFAFAPAGSLFYAAKLNYNLFFCHNSALKIRILMNLIDPFFSFSLCFILVLFSLTFLGFLLRGTDEGDQSG